MLIIGMEAPTQCIETDALPSFIKADAHTSCIETDAQFEKSPGSLLVFTQMSMIIIKFSFVNFSTIIQR